MGARKKPLQKQTKKKKKKGGGINCCGLKKKIKKIGKSLIDRVIDKIPFELHVPKYQYCGPGTHLNERIARGDQGINPLDAACKTHDIAYSKHSDSEERSKADKILQKEAIKRVFARDASIGERAVAIGVATAMKVKRTLSGKGLSKKKRVTNRTKKKHVPFSYLIKNAKIAIKKFQPDDIHSAIRVAINSAKNSKRGKHIKEPRTIKLPCIKGGVLPLIPIFAGLGALGSIVGSSAGVVNAINQAKKGQMEMQERSRHNHTMEAIAIGNKVGNGYYLRSNKQGRGFYLARYKKNR